jgi:hypothetical protein
LPIFRARDRREDYMTTMTDTDKAIRDAAHRLVEGWDAIPQEWAALVAQHIDGDECVAMPMWGTLFKVGMDKGNISKWLQPMGVNSDDDVDDIQEFIEERGLEIDIEDYNLGDEEDPDYDIDELVMAVNDAWRDSMDEDCFLADTGWQRVSDTGVLAREFDGHLLLGINGAGYDFYESHWIPLYKTLDYSWHK